MITFLTDCGGVGNYPVICYRNLLTAGSIATTTAETANPASNLSNPSTSLIWRGTTAGSDEYITMTVTGLGTINYVAVARPNWSATGATVSLEGDTGGGYATIGSTFTLTNDAPLIMMFTASSSYVGLRIKIASGGSDVPQASVVYAGQALILQRKLYVGHSPMPLAREVNAIAPLSESGEFLGRIVLGQHSTGEIALQNLTADWVRTYLDPFMQSALDTPFFFAWRPSNYPAETAFAWIPGGAAPAPENTRSNGMMGITIPIMGITT
jgi:hypothetical protein